MQVNGETLFDWAMRAISEARNYRELSVIGGFVTVADADEDELRAMLSAYSRRIKELDEDEG